MSADPRRFFGSTALRTALIIWLFGTVLVDLMTTIMGRMQPGVNILISIPLLVLGISLVLLLDRLRRRLATRPRLMAWPLLALALCAAAAIETLVDLHWMRWLSFNVFPEWQSWAVVSGQRLATVGLLYLWTFALTLTVIWASDVGSDAARTAARAALAEAATHRAEAAALRLQLNPHFLFNALNSIASLVTLERKAEAERMIDQLSDFLRASLASDPMADVPLADEIDTIDAYLGIETARFGERLEVEIEVEDGAIDALVPNFILQPLVENAIKHGVARLTGPARVEVTAKAEDDELVLSVVNRADPSSWQAVHAQGIGTPSPDPGRGQTSKLRTGIGLDIVRQRLSIEHGERGRLETGPLPDGYRAVIRLPLVKAADRAQA
jgi:two-component system, LytTR family, sensor kinase